MKTLQTLRLVQCDQRRYRNPFLTQIPMTTIRTTKIRTINLSNLPPAVRTTKPQSPQVHPPRTTITLRPIKITTATTTQAPTRIVKVRIPTTLPAQMGLVGLTRTPMVARWSMRMMAGCNTWDLGLCLRELPMVSALPIPPHRSVQRSQ